MAAVSKLISETPEELILKHQSWRKWFGLGIGAALLEASFPLPPFDRLDVILAVTGFAYAMYYVTWPDRLRLDLRTRTWLREFGFGFSDHNTGGTFDDFDGILLIRERFRYRFGWQWRWRILLSFRASGEQIPMDESRDESQAHARLVYLSRRLDLPAFDRTGFRERRVTWSTGTLTADV